MPKHGPLTEVGEALRKVRDAEAKLRETVETAREAGHTWQEIGDLLGTSRQAAFQRFGRPVDPATGESMAELKLPDAVQRAEELVAELVGCNWPEVRRTFDDRMSQAVGEDELRLAWSQVAGSVGRYERMGAGYARSTDEYTVVHMPLAFEAGERTVLVTYRENGQVAGLWIKPSEQ
ncbi:DUF3887 domain-containing protein [Amycolatopsis sp. OK19-0408]|uniref:DUF3887 domain-containing protein n=1 Tax=Amycolatopsis iheyensis TaxID=2945988 RepID=A0A9X2NH48_9PSEU|nr:DUF3887 domain-containing protein [Amycolatopsis iheyensis]MCR6484650.1 DUF3887 domain-containing protein [Amycolatopsis iheyensis]